MANLKATTINGDVTLETGGKIVNSTDGTVELIDTNIKLTGNTTIVGFDTVKSTVTATGGGYTRKFIEATGTPSGTTTYFDIVLSIPASSKLLGVQLRVDTALTTGETWSAAYITGSTTSIASAGTAVAKSTKVNKMHIDEITSATTNIRITRDAGNFTNAVGVIRAIAYYEVLETLSDAP